MITSGSVIGFLFESKGFSLTILSNIFISLVDLAMVICLCIKTKKAEIISICLAIIFVLLLYGSSIFITAGIN